MNKRTWNLVATVGSYTLNGEEKKRYARCGVAFLHEDGNLSLKLDAVPVAPEWSGWMTGYDKDESQNGVRQDSPPSEPVRNTPAKSDSGDEIPF